MAELHKDWWALMAAALHDSGRRQGEQHVELLRDNSGLTGETAATVLNAIDAGQYDLVAFFAPRPIALSTRKSWSRQYDGARVSTGLPREKTPPLSYISLDDETELRGAYIDGLTAGFYKSLEKLAPGRKRGKRPSRDSVLTRLGEYLAKAVVSR